MYMVYRKFQKLDYKHAYISSKPSGVFTACKTHKVAKMLPNTATTHNTWLYCSQLVAVLLTTRGCTAHNKWLYCSQHLAVLLTTRGCTAHNTWLPLTTRGYHSQHVAVLLTTLGCTAHNTWLYSSQLLPSGKSVNKAMILILWYWYSNFITIIYDQNDTITQPLCSNTISVSLYEWESST